MVIVKCYGWCCVVSVGIWEWSEEWSEGGVSDFVDEVYEFYVEGDGKFCEVCVGFCVILCVRVS